MDINSVRNNYTSSSEQNPKSPEVLPKAMGTSNVSKQDRVKSNPDVNTCEKSSPSWHVNLPIKSKATVMMIQAQVLQNKGKGKTISEVISDAIDFYYRHIFNPTML